MKNLNELKVSELSFEEITQIEGGGPIGDLIDDIVEVVETAVEVIKNLKKFTPTL
ncbi:hypothetical protein [Aquimarina macrocephali]|uniref:hypothetical protein n=1 Tax=Aquimarina macrocephali TaxID=666563 RepID=UPI0004B43F9D|nr:hypothetical protein [Aquimarina macrocephali]